MKRLIYIVCLLIFLSCGKEGEPVSEGRSIEFDVATPDVVTKAEVSMDQLQANTNLYLYAAKSDGAVSNPIVSAPGAVLRYDSEREVWDAKTSEYVYSGGSYSLQEVNIEWENNFYYTFYGYCFSSNAIVGSDLVIPTATFGRQFTVTQPETGDGSTTIDYLLSSLVSVAPSVNYPLVPIELEHAMARIDVDVQIADAMFNQSQNPLIKDITVSISDIKRKATMLCQQPKSYGEEGTNTWYITLEAASNAVYTKSIDNSIVNLEGSDTNREDMSFIAVPVLNAHMVKYVLTIDNSIHLKGSVVDYQDVDYIESVLVPDIPGTK